MDSKRPTSTLSDKNAKISEKEAEKPEIKEAQRNEEENENVKLEEDIYFNAFKSIKWSHKFYNVKTLIEEFGDQLPVLIKIKRGFSDKYLNLSTDQILHIHSHDVESRLQATMIANGSQKLLSVPATSNMRLNVGSSKSDIDFSELVRLKRLPVTARVKFIAKFVTKIDRDMIGKTLTFQSISEEPFLRANYINDGWIDQSRIILIPDFLNTQFSVAVGMVSASDLEWTDYHSMFSRAVRHLKFYELTEYDEIIYKDLIIPDEVDQVSSYNEVEYQNQPIIDDHVYLKPNTLPKRPTNKKSLSRYNYEKLPDPRAREKSEDSRLKQHLVKLNLVPGRDIYTALPPESKSQIKRDEANCENTNRYSRDSHLYETINDIMSIKSYLTIESTENSYSESNYAENDEGCRPTENVCQSRPLLSCDPARDGGDCGEKKLEPSPEYEKLCRRQKSSERSSNTNYEKLVKCLKDNTGNTELITQEGKELKGKECPEKSNKQIESKAIDKTSSKAEEKEIVNRKNRSHILTTIASIEASSNADVKKCATTDHSERLQTANDNLSEKRDGHSSRPDLAFQKPAKISATSKVNSIALAPKVETKKLKELETENTPGIKNNNVATTDQKMSKASNGSNTSDSLAVKSLSNELLEYKKKSLAENATENVGEFKERKPRDKNPKAHQVSDRKNNLPKKKENLFVNQNNINTEFSVKQNLSAFKSEPNMKDKFYKTGNSNLNLTAVENPICENLSSSSEKIIRDKTSEMTPPTKLLDSKRGAPVLPEKSQRVVAIVKPLPAAP